MHCLADAAPIVRKRAMALVFVAVPCAPDRELDKVINDLRSALGASPKDARTYVQTLGAVCRAASTRVGKHLRDIVPLLIHRLGSDDDESMGNEAGCELRESVLNAFESLVYYCPVEVGQWAGELSETALKFIARDPNYNYPVSDDEADADFVDSKSDDGPGSDAGSGGSDGGGDDYEYDGAMADDVSVLVLAVARLLACLLLVNRLLSRLCASRVLAHVLCACARLKCLHASCVLVCASRVAARGLLAGILPARPSRSLYPRCSVHRMMRRGRCGAPRCAS